MNLTTLEKLARLRLSEARILAKNGKHDGAVHLCGYVIELSLKKRICKHLDWRAFPSSNNEIKQFATFITHDLDKLLKLAGLERKVKSDSRLRAKWQVINKWKNELRYEIMNKTNEEAKETISATNDLMKYIFNLK